MEGNATNILDIGIGILVLLSALFALYRGFVRETLAIAGWIGAAFATIYAFPYAQPHARELIESELIADLLAGGAIFIVVLSVLWIITHMIVSKIRGSPLNVLDRTLGFLFGIARGVVIVALVYMVINRTLWKEEDDIPEWVTEARALPVIDYAAGLLVTLVPEGTFNLPIEGFDEIQEKNQEIELLRRERELEELSEPPIAPPPDTDSETGYEEDARDELQELNESVVEEP